MIVRPSPFICAEWEFGGLPAWLLKKTCESAHQTQPLSKQWIVIMIACLVVNTPTKWIRVVQSS